MMLEPRSLKPVAQSDGGDNEARNDLDVGSSRCLVRRGFPGFFPSSLIPSRSVGATA